MFILYIIKLIYEPLNFILPSTGTKCTMGNLATDSNGNGSHKHILFSSQPAPSKYRLCTYTPFYTNLSLNYIKKKI